MSLRHIIEESAYTISTLARDFDLPYGVIYGWSRGKIPSKKNLERAKFMSEQIKDTKKVIKHPSFGYATEWEIAKLNEIGVCPERNKILKDIETRTRKLGKI